MNGEKTEIFKLYTKYRNGEVDESQLTDEDRNMLSEIYDREIELLERHNQYRIQKIMKKKYDIKGKIKELNQKTVRA